MSTPGPSRRVAFTPPGSAGGGRTAEPVQSRPMTEQEWRRCRDPRLQLVFLEGRHSDRKGRLYACGVGQRLWPFLADERCRRAIEVAEMNADGLATAEELAAANEAALDAVRGAA